MWMIYFQDRGRTVCRTGKYSLRVIGDALGLYIQTAQPAATASATPNVVKLAKQSPCIPLNVIILIGELTSDERYPSGIRYFSSRVIQVILASPRSDITTQTKHLPVDGRPISGMCAHPNPTVNPPCGGGGRQSLVLQLTVIGPTP